MNINCLGRFPVDGQDARDSGVFHKVTSNNMLHTILGEKNPVLLSFYFSTQFLNFGVIEIPTGGIGPRYSEIMKHEGDAILYCLKEELTIQIIGSEDVFQALIDEAIFIPQGVSYRCVNYTKGVVKAVFAICPRL